jgi:GDP-mannose transporter
VISSVIAAWSDVTTAVTDMPTTVDFSTVSDAVRNLNAGYMWMMANCLVSAAYVRSPPPFHFLIFERTYCDNGQVLTMRKRIKATGFSDWDSMFYNNTLSVPVLIVFSLVFEDWGTENLARNLCVIFFFLICSNL